MWGLKPDLFSILCKVPKLNYCNNPRMIVMIGESFTRLKLEDEINCWVRGESPPISKLTIAAVGSKGYALNQIAKLSQGLEETKIIVQTPNAEALHHLLYLPSTQGPTDSFQDIWKWEIDELGQFASMNFLAGIPHFHLDLIDETTPLYTN